MFIIITAENHVTLVPIFGQNRDGRVVRWCWVNFQCRGVLQFEYSRGWSGGAMVLGKLPASGRPTNLDYSSRARAYCACIRCGWGLFGHFFSRLSFLFSFSLSLGDGPI